jgi:hypothetical protein
MTSWELMLVFSPAMYVWIAQDVCSWVSIMAFCSNVVNWVLYSAKDFLPCEWWFSLSFVIACNFMSSGDWSVDALSHACNVDHVAVS